MDLDSLKYVELQRLAKEVGMKANIKVNRVYQVTLCSAVLCLHAANP